MAEITLDTFQPYPATHGYSTVTGAVTLRLWYNRNFQDSEGVDVQGGNGSTGFYRSVTCTLSSGNITVPAFTLRTTIDANDANPQSIQCFARFYSNNTPKDWLFQGASTPNGWIIYNPDPLTSWTFAQLQLLNQNSYLANPPLTYPTTQEMIDYVNSTIGTTSYASLTHLGSTYLDTTPAVSIVPRAIGTNSTRIFAAIGNTQVIANNMTGSDVGAQINAADAILGSSKGVIVYLGGGTISTQIILNSNHTLYLGAGTYTCSTSGCPVLMKQDTTLYGDGFQTVITETSAPSDGSGNQFNVIAMYGQYFDNGSPTRNITIRDLQVAGNRSDFNSAAPAIGLGNCHEGLVDNVFLNGTHSIGINAGGSSTTGSDPLGLGRYAEDVTVTNCVAHRVASQNFSCVNGKNVTFDGNHILNPSQTGGPGVTVIDCEVNDPANDKMEGIQILNNTLDARDSEISPHGNFIAYQPGNVYTGPARISGNIAVSAFHTANGVVLTSYAKNVEVSNNFLSGMGQSGLALQGSYLTVIGNTLRDTGTGGVDSISLVGVTNSRISNNFLQSPTLGSDTIAESAGANNNFYKGNVLGSSGAPALVGASSKFFESTDYSTGKNYSNNIYLSGSTSGATGLVASSTASGLLTLPAATDTIVARATNDTLTNKTIVGANNTVSGITETMLSTSDITTLNATSAKHGFLPKLSNSVADVLRGDGTWGAVAPTVTWTAPTLLNSWQNFGGSDAVAGYTKVNGIVYLKGTVKLGTIGTGVFTLPTGYRPAADRIFAVVSNGAFGVAVVDSSGSVSASAGNNAYFSLDNISFPAEQ